MQAYPHRYHAKASGQSEGGVLINGEGLPELSTQPPAEFGGPGDRWSPETLLTGAVADCFILTFRAIARASKLEWHHLTCDVEGVLERVGRSTLFTRFNISAELHVPAQTREELARRLLEKSEEVCLVTTSLKADTELKTEIRVQ